MARRRNLVIIGASTGGVRAIQTILDDLPRLDASIVIVQHMPDFMGESLAAVFGRCTHMTVRVAKHGERIEQGTIYIAPGGEHLLLVGNVQIKLVRTPKVHFVRPAVDVTMESLVASDTDRILGVLLTGMGSDGAAGIVHIKSIGGTTIAQDEESSVIYGMPKVAQETGCVDYAMSPTQIRERLIALFGVRQVSV